MNSTLVRTLLTWIVLAGIVGVPTQCLGQQFQPIDFIPSSAMAAIDCKPKDAIAQPSMEIIPHELIKVFGEQELGLDLLEISRLTLVVDQITDAEMKDPPEFGVIVRFDTQQTLSDEFTKEFEKSTIEGKTRYRQRGGSILILDDNTILIGSNAFIPKMLSAKGAKSPLISLINSSNPTDHLNTYLVMEPVRALIKQNLPPREQIPGPFRDFLDIPDLVESVTFRSNFSQNPVSEYTIRAVDEKSTKKLKRLIAHGFDLGKNAALSFITTQTEIPPAYQQATLAYAERLSVYLESAIQPKIDGRDMVFDMQKTQQLNSVATTGILIGMLLPAVQQVREAARRTESMNNLRQLMLSALNYESAHGNFPMNANYDDDGEPLLSWRVHMLPFLDQKELYEQFHLDEPWDSPHNIKLLEKMPPTFRNPNVNLPEHMTVYVGLTGPGTIFPGNKEVGFSNIVDGASNTAMLVEANESHAVEWTRPKDLNFDPDDPFNGLGDLRPSGFVCAFADGSVKIIDKSVDWEIWKSFVLISDGR